jgi:hypothetical protein
MTAGPPLLEAVSDGALPAVSDIRPIGEPAAPDTLMFARCTE